MELFSKGPAWCCEDRPASGKRAPRVGISSTVFGVRGARALIFRRRARPGPGPHRCGRVPIRVRVCDHRFARAVVGCVITDLHVRLSDVWSPICTCGCRMCAQRCARAVVGCVISNLHVRFRIRTQHARAIWDLTGTMQRVVGVDARRGRVTNQTRLFFSIRTCGCVIPD